MEVALLIILWSECFQCSYSLFPEVHFGSEAHPETVILTLMAHSSLGKRKKKVQCLGPTLRLNLNYSSVGHGHWVFFFF